jgi:hypothetical protein
MLPRRRWVYTSSGGQEKSSLHEGNEVRGRSWFSCHNPGNWQETTDAPAGGLPSTRFTAARFLAYRLSQRHRQALPDETYASFFEKGEISEALAETLLARYREKKAAGQWVPDLGL